MSTPQKNQFDGNYLERYRKGLLTPAEAHALEKAALDDPLLADAMEGYMNMERDTASERSFLKSWINERVEENQAAIRYIPRQNNFQPFLRVAAVFLVLIGAAWMGYVLWLEPQEPVLADRGPVPATAPQTPKDIQSTESNSTTTATIAQAESKSTTPQSLPDKTAFSAPTKDENWDKTVAAQETPVADATQPVAKATAPEPVVSHATETEKAITAETVRSESIPARAAQEVESRQLSAKNKSTLMVDSPAPIDGWDKYEKYLDGQREAAPTADNRITSTQVTLSFLVGEDGRPKDIRVEKSGGSFYDDKAIGILKKGPDWKSGKSDQRGLLQLRF